MEAAGADEQSSNRSKGMEGESQQGMWKESKGRFVNKEGEMK